MIIVATYDGTISYICDHCGQPAYKYLVTFYKNKNRIICPKCIMFEILGESVYELPKM